MATTSPSTTPSMRMASKATATRSPSMTPETTIVLPAAYRSSVITSSARTRTTLLWTRWARAGIGSAMVHEPR
jgi:hypothetical protein